MKKRVTASYVILYFKALFMKRVAEAVQLPERHWYAEHQDGDNEAQENGDGSDETPGEVKIDGELLLRTPSRQARCGEVGVAPKSSAITQMQDHFEEVCTEFDVHVSRGFVAPLWCWSQRRNPGPRV